MHPFAPFASAGLLLAAAAHAADYRVTVASADFDRAGQTLAFKLPADAPRPAILRDAAGQLYPLQVDAEGNAQFFVASQKKGEALQLALTAPAPGAPAPAAAPGVAVKNENGRLLFSVGEKPVFTYQMDLPTPPRAGVDPKMLRGGYIHPLYSPAGRLLTDDFPRDHAHHHGLWTAWAGAEFLGRKADFWNTHYAEGGIVEFVATDKVWDGPVAGGFTARHRYMDRVSQPPVAALDEKWSTTLYAAPGLPGRLLDMQLAQTVAGDAPVVLPKYRYGGLGFRGNAEWLNKANCVILNAEGLTSRPEAAYKKTRWFFLGGKVDGELAGLAMLSHPDNFRAPQPVWINPDQPFLSFTPQQETGFEISREKPYQARYRLVLVDGAPDAKFLEACWQGYAHPGPVTVTPR